MDDRRFDSLTKSLAAGANRRTLLKGLLGLGGAATAGSILLDDDADAARRPTPTPKPPSCPGQQTPVGGQCVCQTPKAPGPEKCGPDCCNPAGIGAAHSECCDNACCYGVCYGEELCCSTNPRPGGLPPLQYFCDSDDGVECCFSAQDCCRVDGCCDTFCHGGLLGNDSCCPAEQVCLGGDDSDDICCNAGETCCGSGTNGRYCADFSTGGCCETSDCPPPANGACANECVVGQCQPVTCSSGQICCQGACVSSESYEACPADPDGCCVRGEEVCCGGGGCCPGDNCNEIGGVCCDPLQTACGTGDNACCDELFTCCGSARICCLDELCTTDGDCCSGQDIACGAECCPEIRCGTNAVTGGLACCPEGFIACGGICCSAAIYQCSTTGPGCECLPGTEACGLLPGGCCPDGQCNHNSGECCDAGTSPCGSMCCPNGLCVNGVCSCADSSLVRCDNGQCQECCGSALEEIANCQVLYGYDLNCVYCPSGFCDTNTFQGSLCDTDDTGELGKCDAGFCIPCGGGASAPCTDDSECCSGECQVDTGQCTDP